MKKARRQMTCWVSRISDSNRAGEKSGRIEFVGKEMMSMLGKGRGGQLL